MSAVAGTFVAIQPIATRKVVRLQIECPIEMADNVLKVLGGYPDPANPKWVGIAQLTSEPKQEAKGGKLAQRAGILCNEGAFKAFCKETHGFDDPVEAIYSVCGVTSRANLDHDEHAGREFLGMVKHYDVWRMQ